MGLSVGADNSGPVDRKDDRKLLQAYIGDDLVVGALQECGIHCDHRLHPACRKSGREGHRMLLSNSHIKKPVGIADVKTLQAHTVLHGRRNSHKLGLFRRKAQHGRGKGICIGRLLPRFFRHTGFNIKRRRSVEL